MTKLVGKKVKMTQVFKDDVVVPVSVIKMNEDSDLSVLKSGGLVKVSGISKGKGFAGVMKRHGFHGGPKTHGQKNRQRAPGSIGNTTPQRVIPGRKMAGHMGVERVTVKNLKVVDVDSDKKTVLLRGAVPGNNGNKIEIFTELRIKNHGT